MPIILYFSRPIKNRAAVERALEIKTSKRVIGAWRWDDQCGTAPECLYFRPRHYWRPAYASELHRSPERTRGRPGGLRTPHAEPDVHNGFLADRGCEHRHYMNVFRDGKKFAHWPISTGQPGDDTPDGTYLTIEKANPVDMVGPGYDIEVPLSVRITWGGDYLHAAFWSVGEQGSTNVGRGCVDMSPADAAIYYRMAVPGDPVRITGSPRAGTWDNGWTMWFLPWNRWVRGSALHQAVNGPARMAARFEPSPSPQPPAQHHSEGPHPGALLSRTLPAI